MFVFGLFVWGLKVKLEYQFAFEKLKVWQNSREMVIIVYKITNTFPDEERYCLVNQIRRAIISVSSNIVEGFEKNNNNEFIRFLKIAKGSIGEVKNQLYIAFAVSYIISKEFESIKDNLENLAKQIGGFIVYLEKKRKNKEFLKK